MERLRITPGFLLLSAVLFYLDEGSGILVCCLPAVLVHELAHFAVGTAFGGTFRRAEFSAVGIQLTLSYPRALSYRRELLVLLAGPAANLVLWLAASCGQAYLLGGVSLVMGLFNLMPVGPLDGGQALCCLSSLWFGEGAGDRLRDICGAVLSGAAMGMGGIAAARFGNFSLLITSCWLFWLCIGGKRKKL